MVVIRRTIIQVDIIVLGVYYQVVFFSGVSLHSIRSEWSLSCDHELDHTS